MTSASKIVKTNENQTILPLNLNGRRRGRRKKKKKQIEYLLQYCVLCLSQPLFVK